MLSLRPLLLAAGLATLLVGCATSPQAPSADDYQPPVAGASVATLKGSRFTEGGLFGEEHTGFVYMIDLQSVSGARDHWDQAIALTPGKHAIMAEYRFSNFKARATLALTASAGHSYQLMFKYGRDNTPELTLFCNFWMVDWATGETVTPIHRAQVMGGKQGTIFNVPT